MASRKNKRTSSKRKAARKPAPPPSEAPASSESQERGGTSWFLLPLGLGVLASLIWAYWPTLVRLVEVWETEPDYSHGYLVIPLACCFLWARRARFPGWQGPAWFGLVLIALSLVVRSVGTLYYVDAVEAWSLLVWCAGAAWLLGGRSMAVWAWPAIAFLFFMIPLPFRAERLLSLPLQGIATDISVWMLQVIGQPALAEGHVIWVGEHHLEVAEACSGLRIFMGILALAFAYLILIRSGWWERVLVIASVLPVALLANSLRIVTTAILYQFASSELAQRFSHDLAGWLVVPVAAVMLGLVIWYVKKLLPEVEVVDPRQLVRQQALG